MFELILKKVFDGLLEKIFQRKIFSRELPQKIKFSI